MKYACLNDLRSTRQRLERRQWAIFMVDGLLVGSGLTWIILFFVCFGLASGWVAAVAGPCVSIVVIAWLIRTHTIRLGDAGLYLDRSFGLKERMSAVACLDNVNSIFSAALLDDADKSMRAIRGTSSRQNMIPSRASYLAIPAAATLALLLLAPAILPQNKPSANPARIATPLTVTPTNTANRLEGKLQQILSELRQANARFSKTGNAADRARVQRLQQQLYQELSRLRQAEQTIAKTPAIVAVQPRKSGQAPHELRIRAQISAKRKHLDKTSNRTNPDPSGPDWAALPLVESAIPAMMRKRVRAYMNAINMMK